MHSQQCLVGTEGFDSLVGLLLVPKNVKTQYIGMYFNGAANDDYNILHKHTIGFATSAALTPVRLDITESNATNTSVSSPDSTSISTRYLKPFTF